jgi:hypothetical protein
LWQQIKTKDMPQQFGNLIQLIAKQADIDPTDKALADLLSVQATISDELYNKIQHWTQSVHTLDAAKNIPELDRHYRQRTLNPIDMELERMAEEMGLSDDARQSLQAEKSTYRRIRQFVEQLKAANDNTQTEKAQQQQLGHLQALATLQAQLDQQHTDRDHALTAQQQKDQDRLTRYAIRSWMQSKQFAHDNLDQDTWVATATQLLDQSLAEQGLSLTMNDRDQLSLQTLADQKPYTENQTQISFGDYADRLLASRTMLRISDLYSPPTGTTSLPTHIEMAQLPKSNKAVVSEIDRMLADLSTNPHQSL